MPGFQSLRLDVLSPVDHSFPDYNPCYYLYFRSPSASDVRTSLQRGLEKLIKILPFITGEVVPCDGDRMEKRNGLLCIKYTASPDESLPIIEFREDMSLSVENISTSKTRTGLEDVHLAKTLAPLPLTPNPSRPSYVVRFRATTVRDGVVLAMSFSHFVFDATGAGHLMEHFAECVREPEPKPCDIDQETLRQALWHINGDTGVIPNEPGDCHSLPAFMLPPGGREAIPEMAAPGMRVCRWKISAAKVELLKNTCNDLLRSLDYKAGDNSVNFLSSQDVLTGLLTTCLKHDPKGKVEGSDIGVAVNLRNRLSPEWPTGYFGNMAKYAIAPGLAEPTAEELAVAHRLVAENPKILPAASDIARLYRNACSIRHTISQISDVHIRGFVSWLNSCKDLGPLTTPFPFINFTSWRHLNLYELDFGGALGYVDDIQTHGMMPTLGIILPRAKAVQGTEAHWDVLFYVKNEDYPAVMKQGLLRFLTVD
uniref:O-acetyltransferase andG n=1 Tax=Emericella variicolor TaxID=1549217 RepID=ANDG_EMEVA|nr:RecName: Full=O-acetyltransferase andG; AltName: Full=Anditomin synthesis protein G [Aspergillus stellatus]BAP81861.1 AndG [Aspergillus stellatus]